VTINITLDTGVLVAMERRKPRATFLVRNAREGGSRLLVPMPVVAEWWRGRSDRRDEILAMLEVEDVAMRVAKAAGEAIAELDGRRVSVVDALVMAHAAHHGGIVYTSDLDDLALLRDACFPSVRVLTI
jgi:predicted nucleic acid-binding protein